MVKVTEIEPAQLADPDTGGVQQLHDRGVAQDQRLVGDPAHCLPVLGLPVQGSPGAG